MKGVIVINPVDMPRGSSHKADIASNSESFDYEDRCPVAAYRHCSLCPTIPRSRRRCVAGSLTWLISASHWASDFVYTDNVSISSFSQS